MIERHQICKKSIPFDISPKQYFDSHNEILLSRLVDGEGVAELPDEDQQRHLGTKYLNRGTSTQILFEEWTNIIE